MGGDRVLTQATSAELEKYGCPVGHTNYGACYATGLLIARRALQIVGLDQICVGVEECNAEEFHIEEEDTERRPLKAFFDVGLERTGPGAKVFGILKGAVDGGLHVPHSVKKFPGYKEPEERGMDYEYDAAAHLERIIGAHVQEYMEMLQEEDPERYKVAFAKYIENDIEPDGVEDMYRECHKKIREDPKFPPSNRLNIENKRVGNKIHVYEDGKKTVEYVRKVRLTLSQRRAKVADKMNAAREKLLANMADDDDEE